MRLVPALLVTRPRVAAAVTLTLVGLAVAAPPASAAVPPPPPSLSSPTGPVTVGTPTSFTAVCAVVPEIDPADVRLRWDSSDDISVFGTPLPSSTSPSGTTFEFSHTFVHATSWGFVEAQCLYPAAGGGTVYSFWNMSEFPVLGAVDAPTTTTLTLGAASSSGDVSGTVSVARTSGTGTPTGSVTIAVDGHDERTLTLDGGSAAVSLTGLAPGSRTVTATYTGAAGYATSSASRTVTVKAGVWVDLSVPWRAYAGVETSIEATVASSVGGATPTGTVQFRYSEGAVLGTVALVGGAASLTVTPTVDLPDVVAVYSGDATYSDGSSVYRDLVVRDIPTPTVTVTAPTTATTAGLTATITVTGEEQGGIAGQSAGPEGGVQLIIHEVGKTPVSVTNGTLVNGTVTVTTGTLPPGTYRLLAHYSGAPGSMFQQADSADQPLVVPGPVTPTPTPTPSPTATPDPEPTPADPRVELSEDTVAAGSPVTVVARGFEAGETVRFALRAPAVELGDATASAAGVAQARVVLPADLAAGEHVVVATGASSGRVALVPVTVTAAASSDEDEDEDEQTPSDEPEDTTTDEDDELAATGAASRDLVGLVALLIVGGAALAAAPRLRRPRA